MVLSDSVLQLVADNQGRPLYPVLSSFLNNIRHRVSFPMPPINYKGLLVYYFPYWYDSGRGIVGGEPSYRFLIVDVEATGLANRVCGVQRWKKSTTPTVF